MVDVTTTITIHFPQKEVYEFTINPDNAPVWYKNIKSVEWKSEKPFRTGSKVAFVAQFLGKTLVYVYEAIDLTPYQKLVMRTNYGPFLMETTYEFLKTEKNSTIVTLRNRGNPSGFSKIITPFLTIAMKQANKKDLQTLKKVLEK